MRLLFQLTLLSYPLIAPVALAADSVEGRYWTEDRNGVIEMYLESDEMKGRILWRSEPLLDENNPNPSLRGRSMVGVTFLSGFEYKDGQWRGGEVYSADNGRNYTGKLWLEDEGQTLKMRGFLGISLLGRTASFQRLTRDDSIPEKE